MIIQRTSTHSPATRGFTILEVVIAMIIISILTLVMMPTVTNRANNARLRAAEADLMALAEAQSRASIDMNYYVAPWRLNNVIGSGDPFLSTQNNDNTLGGYTNYNAMFIDTVTLDIPGNVNQIHADFIANETRFGWGGPYVNYRRFEREVNWPQDPWGNEYLLFTKAGALFPPDTPGVNDSEFETTGPAFTGVDGNSIPGLTTIGLFDRPTWLSLGPNQLPGDGDGSPYGTGDDIFVSFEGFDGSTGP
jgi:prepilin-type N-terminal cleavage/methylation domain-containing protein